MSDTITSHGLSDRLKRNTRKVAAPEPTAEADVELEVVEDVVVEVDPSERWVSPALRAALTAKVAADAARADHRNRLEQANADLAAVLAEPTPDLDAAERIMARIVALDRLAPLLPAAEVPPDLAAQALALAQRDLFQLGAEAVIDPPAYLKEKAAWRALGPAALDVDPPVATPADRDAVSAFEAVMVDGEKIAAGIQGWQDVAGRPGSAKVEDLLNAAAAYHDQLAAAIDRANAVSVALRAADKARAEADLTWSPPKSPPPPSRALPAPGRVVTRVAATY